MSFQLIKYQSQLLNKYNEEQKQETTTKHMGKEENGINFTDPFILSVTEIARKQEKSSQVIKGNSSSKKKKTGKVKMY